MSYFIISSCQKIGKPIQFYFLIYRWLLFYIIHLLCHWVIISNSVTPFQKISAIYFNYYYYSSIHIIYFILITYHSFFLVWIYIQKKTGNNTLKSSLGILSESTETKNNFRVKLIVESEICFLLNFDRYSSDWVDPVL